MEIENKDGANCGTPFAETAGSAILEWTREHEAVTEALMDAVEDTYPVGSVIRAEIRQGVQIEAEVIEYRRWSRYPHELYVRNVKTGKERCVTAHPRYGHKVELLHSPNAQADPLPGARQPTSQDDL